MSKVNKHRLALIELVETILEGESGRDIDAGWDSDGPLARSMVLLGMARDTEEATIQIFGPDEEGDDTEDEEE